MKWLIHSRARYSHREEQTSRTPSGDQFSAAAQAPSAVLWHQGAGVALAQVGAPLLPSLAAPTYHQWCLSQSILVMQLLTLSVINELRSNLPVPPISRITQKDQNELLFLKMMLSFTMK